MTGKLKLYLAAGVVLLAVILWFAYTSHSEIGQKLRDALQHQDDVVKDVQAKDEAIRALSQEIATLSAKADAAKARAGAAEARAQLAANRAGQLEMAVATLEAKIKARGKIDTRAKALEALHSLGY